MVFLGIDHTAIAVEDTERALRFYRDTLGLREAGHSENWGPEQERLNAVFGAHLRITQVRAPTGPGIEFLEYLTPRDGRPYPSDERASDFIHWHTVVLTEDMASVDPARSWPPTRNLFQPRQSLRTQTARSEFAIRTAMSSNW